MNPDIWVGLGNALFVHGGGVMNPAPRFAFEKAKALSPDHPGPAFFLGLGLIQEGKTDEAAALWQGLLDRAPKDAPFRDDLQKRVDILNQLFAAPQNQPPQTSGEAPLPQPDAGSSRPIR
jgi:cytochrome c-type biogenesis protein CcmH